MHTHIIPRRFRDLEKEDQIYTMLESTDGDLGRSYLEAHSQELDASVERPKFPTIPLDSERRPRTEQVMKEEAVWLAEKIRESGVD